MLDKTMIFSLGGDRDDEIKIALTTVYDALQNIISKIDRDDLLEALVKSYLNI